MDAADYYYFIVYYDMFCAAPRERHDAAVILLRTRAMSMRCPRNAARRATRTMPKSAAARHAAMSAIRARALCIMILRRAPAVDAAMLLSAFRRYARESVATRRRCRHMMLKTMPRYADAALPAKTDAAPRHRR